MKSYNVNPKKVLGQNFLIDNNIKEKIINSIELNKEDVIVEIGPGLGVLTEKISNIANKVIAYEIDKDLVNVLNDIFKDKNNVSIIHQDILKANIEEDLKNFKKIKLVANLPYYITTPIIFKFLESSLDIDQIVIMVQKEVAERISATPGNKNYSALSVAVQYFSNPNIMMNVSPKCFYPEPKVKSSVIKLDINNEKSSIIKNREFFFKFVRSAFGQRRKTLVNALFNSQYFNLTKKEIENILINEGFDIRIRAEKLDFLQFVKLSNSFLDKYHEKI
jgi:16S rRNA (adenine1518-N6/adenine1519-N6)-dimethyltransferase